MIGVEEALPEGASPSSSPSGKPLRVKLGIDPSTPDIHLGHVVVLTKLAQFQRAGHTVVLIIGDFTARIGDPSGRATTRPVLAPEEIEANAKTYQEQAGRSRSSIGRRPRCVNSERPNLQRRSCSSCSRVTVARLLEREDLTRRMKADQPISSLELLYPLLQGVMTRWRSSRMHSWETTWSFNLLFAGDIQRSHGAGAADHHEADPPGIDGKQKMSKSLGHTWASPIRRRDMFGTDADPDAAPGTYYASRGEAVRGVTRWAARALGRRIVERFHDAEAAAAAEERLDTVHVVRGCRGHSRDLAQGEPMGSRRRGQTARKTCRP